MDKEVRKNIITDLCQEQETINFKERTVNTTKQHTVQHSLTMDTQSNKTKQNKTKHVNIIKTSQFNFN